MKPQVCILRTDGTNCDKETAHAFKLAGGEPTFVHINTLRTRKATLSDYQILAIPGGFSHGDDIASGQVLAIELMTSLKDELEVFIARNTLILGICNGFQVLVRTGLLPNRRFGSRETILTHNVSGKFGCRWVYLVVEESPCIFTQSFQNETIMLPVAHGEGQFCSADPVKTLIHGETVVRYADKDGNITFNYPANPNGSLQAIAGICDPTGRIFGLMPHPERYIDPLQNRDDHRSVPCGLPFFQNAVNYFR